jgi:hypothetical protein
LTGEELARLLRLERIPQSEVNHVVALMRLHAFGQ